MGMGTKDQSSSWAPSRENNSFGTCVARWLGWAGIVLGVLALIPWVGFFVSLVAGLRIVVAGLLLARWLSVPGIPAASAPLVSRAQGLTCATQGVRSSARLARPPPRMAD